MTASTLRALGDESSPARPEPRTFRPGHARPLDRAEIERARFALHRELTRLRSTRPGES